MITGTFALWRVNRAINRVGQNVTIRYITTGGGAAPLLNPPYYANVTVNGNQSLGAGTISIHGKTLSGKLLQGDIINVAGDTTNYTVQSAASASSNALTATISPVLGQNQTDGAVVSFTFVADVSVQGVVNSFPLHLIDGTRVMQNDLQVTVPAMSIDPPTTMDKIILNGTLKQIVSVNPYYLNGVITHYTIQAR